MSDDYEGLFLVNFDTDEEEHFRISEKIIREIPIDEKEKSFTKKNKLFKYSYNLDRPPGFL